MLVGGLFSTRVLKRLSLRIYVIISSEEVGGIEGKERGTSRISRLGVK